MCWGNPLSRMQARWIYCGGATALLGKILENGTKQAAHDYARAVLLDDG
jgi:hypothetical protein